MVCSMIDAVAMGGNIVDQCVEQDLSSTSFYRWLDEHPDLSERFESAKLARTRLAQERMWRLAQNEDDVGANGRRTAAYLIEKAVQFQEVQRNPLPRPKHEIEHTEVPQLQRPIIQINLGRPDKPPGWKITDEFPEMGDHSDTKKPEQPSVLDLEVLAEQKAGYIGE